MTLLLDALNEMPAADERELDDWTRRWRRWLQGVAADARGNRVIFSCRSLDYSQPLSSPELRVPQVRIEPLVDAQVQDFLRLHSPLRWREIWQSLDGSPQLVLLRSPYFLSLLVTQVEATGDMPAGRAALFTGLIPVSYTHLDVYKRQVYDPGEDGNCCPQRRSSIPGSCAMARPDAIV